MSDLSDGRERIRGGAAGKQLEWKNVGALLDALKVGAGNDATVGAAVAAEPRQLACLVQASKSVLQAQVKLP